MLTIELNDNNFEIIKEKISISFSKRETLNKLGLSTNNGNNFKKLDIIIHDNNIDTSHFKREIDLNKIHSFIMDCLSYKDVGIKLGIATVDKNMSARNYTKIKRFIDEHNIDISHFSELGRHKNANVRYSIEEIFILGSSITQQTLKSRYIKLRISNKIQIDACDICNTSNWCGQTLNLQLDHINGVNDDNRLENLRLICPNCHSQTTTFCRKTNK